MGADELQCLAAEDARDAGACPLAGRFQIDGQWCVRRALPRPLTPGVVMR